MSGTDNVGLIYDMIINHFGTVAGKTSCEYDNANSANSLILFRVLLNLPRDGDRVEVITSSSHDFSTTRRLYCDNKPNKTTYDVVADKVLRTPSQKSDEVDTQKSEVSSSIKKGTTQSCSKTSPLACTTPAPPGIRTYVKGTAASPSRFEDVIKSTPPNKAQIVPGSVQISPLRQMEGVAIDLVVAIKMKSGGSRTVNMQIECPHFIPKRIMIDGKWHNII
ncbi:hypothetical protein RB195_016517 [Necator americanus]|uniref:Uncharacterized protein n=1 Tax=Necator americanus TaxID=51031 RepID=A0ABR1C454_NECAM